MNKKQLWVFILILLGFIWVFYLMFFYQGEFGMGYEVPGNQLTKTYLKVGDYKIGKQKWFYNNSIGRQIGEKYSNLSDQELLDKLVTYDDILMYGDYDSNYNIYGNEIYNNYYKKISGVK